MNVTPYSRLKAALAACALFIVACVAAPRPAAEQPRPAAPQTRAAAPAMLSLLPVYAEDLRLGPAAAEVTLVSFLDFSRDTSREAYLQLRYWAETESGKRTRLVFKHGPSLPDGVSIASTALAIQRAKGDIAALAFLDDVARSSALSEAELVASAFATEGAAPTTVPTLSLVEQLDRDLKLQERVNAVASIYVNGAAMPEDTKLVNLERQVIAERALARALKQRYSDPSAIYALRVQDNLRDTDTDVDTTSPLTERVRAPSWGSPLAPVTIVAFLDYQCPFCSRVVPTLDRVREHYGADRVRIVYRHNPLPFHKDARPAADAASTVFALGGNTAFEKFHRLAFEHQKELTPENFVRWAELAGVSARAFKAASGKYDSTVAADMELAQVVGATGTPAFRINGVTLSGAQPLDRFQALIDEQLTKAAKLREQGVPASRVSALLTKEQFTAAPPAAKREPPPPEDVTVWKLPVTKDDPVLGPADALVTIVEFADLQCPFCARVQNTLDEVVSRYGGDVRIVWKDNILPFHNRAAAAATAARVVFDSKGDAAFFTAVRQIFQAQRELSDEGLIKATTGTGVNPERVRKALVKLPYTTQLQQSTDLANEVSARGTPHFFINGRRLSGARPIEKFVELIDQQLLVARKLVESGVARDQVYETLMKTAQSAPEPAVVSAPPPISPAPFRGPADAKLVIEVFSEFQCPYCNRVNSTLNELRKEFPAVKLVWRHMPLAFHQDAPLAAEAAHEVFSQLGNKAFWRYHDALFAEQTKGLGRETLERLARGSGVNMKQFRQALDSRKHQARVQADMDAAGKAGVHGTPAFIVGKYFLSGAQPIGEFRKLIKRQ